MSMDPAGRANAMYSAISANNPKLAQMTSDEQNKLRANLQAIFGADLTYIKSNAEVPGAQYTAPTTSCTVATSTGPASGSTTPATIQGDGRII